MRVTQNHSREAGFTMVEIAVVVALLGVAAVFGYRQLNMSQGLNKKLADRYDLHGVSEQLERFVDCRRVPACSSGQYITLFQSDPGDKTKDLGILLQRDRSTRMRGWAVAAKCGEGRQFSIVVAKPAREPGKFERDPVTGKLLDWNRNMELFPEGTLCPAVAEGLGGDPEAEVSVMSGVDCYVGSYGQLPCNPPNPPPCGAGMVSTGISLDTFGGDDSNNTQPVHGQRWVRYCSRR